ncbi:MAG TPA: hypothetical protein VGE68_11505 [Sphingomicrobium sp.]
MPYYRLYFLDRRGRFGRVEGFAAQDDDAAVQVAEVHAETVKELWCGGRRVRQWNGHGKAA